MKQRKLRKKDHLIQGVGVNDADYPLVITEYIGIVNGKHKCREVWRCPFYIRWINLIRRCYTPDKSRNPTYEGCYVCPEWLYFSNFKAWVETQDHEGKALDKDILFPGNKLYSPETCVFITKELNNFTNDHGNARGKYPIGTSFDSDAGKFKASINNPITKRVENLGRYSDPMDGHRAWLKRKIEIAKLLAAQQTDERIAKALVDRYENYDLYFNSGTA